MRGSNLTNRVCLISQAVILVTTLLANPALSLDFGSPNSNQSSKFFNQGSQQFDQEIKLLEANLEPIEIKRPQNFDQLQDFNQSNSWHQQQKLQPQLNLTSDDGSI